MYPVSNTTAPSAAGLRDTNALPAGATNWPPIKLPSACTGEVHHKIHRRARSRKGVVSSGPRMPSLIFLAGPIAGRRYKLGEGEYVIGRRSDCQIFVPDMRVSRQHARLWRDGENWSLRGSRLEQRHVHQRHPVAVRDAAASRRRDHDREQQDPRRSERACERRQPETSRGQHRHDRRRHFELADPSAR